MPRRSCGTGLCAAAGLAAAEASFAQTREDAAWRWMLEACAGYLETGERAVFANPAADGALVAHPEGGVCNGDPVCETPEMTFIGSGAAGQGAVTVEMRDGRVVGDGPGHVRCAPAVGTPMRLSQVAAARGAWLEARVADGRLRRAREAVYEGCAWNGRRWRLVLSDYGGALSTFSAWLTPDYPDCAGPLS